MSISFECESCGKAYTLSDNLAGKKGKCKTCGNVMRIPQPGPTTLTADDLYGIDDGPAAPLPPKSNRAAYRDDGLEPPMPRRAGFGLASKPKSKSKGEPWGLGIRRFASLTLTAFVVISMFTRRVPAEFATEPAMLLIGFGLTILLLIGVIATSVSVVGAGISFAGGNRRAFACETWGQVADWVVDCGLSSLFLAGFFIGLSNAIRGVPQLAAGPAQEAPGAFPDRPAAPPKVPNFGPPRTGPEIKVWLSNGKFMRNSSPIGTSMPGVAMSIDYQIQQGELEGLEQYVLVIKSPKARGELTTLHEMRMNTSGTIGASSFMAKPEEGPYEAWMEVAARPGLGVERRKVSDVIPLQFTDVPVRDLAQEARVDAAENLRRAEANRKQAEEHHKRFEEAQAEFRAKQKEVRDRIQRDIERMRGPNFPGPQVPRGGRFGPR